MRQKRDRRTIKGKVRERDDFKRTRNRRKIKRCILYIKREKRDRSTKGKQKEKNMGKKERRIIKVKERDRMTIEVYVYQERNDLKCIFMATMSMRLMYSKVVEVNGMC